MTSTQPKPVAEITRLALQDLPTLPTASITDVKQLSSYNWIEARTPTIAIPGSPALWSALRGPQRLRKDSGLIYIAQNAARHPDSPLESLFRALYTAHPSFDIRSVDVVTDRNNIRKLLSFIDPGSTTNGVGTFTINIEVRHKTAILCRDETATHEFIGPHEFRGYGHEFEKAYTRNQVTGSSGHHRIISYDFGGLTFIVRHETDGYVAEAVSPPPESKKAEKDSLSSMLESLSLVHKTPAANISLPGSKLTVKKAGQEVSLGSTLEIKTRVSHRRLSIRDVAPQLWISQTPKLVRAYHVKGTFQEPEVEDVVDEIKKWEEANQAALRQLAALIKKIACVVQELGGNAVLRYDDKSDKLVFWMAEGKQMLPVDVYSKWGDGDCSEDESDGEA